MLESASSRACSAILAAAVVALSACDNQSNPNTSPELRSTQTLTAQTALSADSSLLGYFTLDSLASTTFVIGGPSSYYTAEVFKPSSGNYTMQVYMVQQQDRQLVDVKGPLCPPPFASNYCRIDWEIAAPRAAGLVPGAAVVEWQLFLDNVLVSTRDLAMTLAPAQTVGALTLSASSMTLGGAPATYNVTLRNAGSSLSGATIQSWIVQPGNNARRAAGGTSTQCGGRLGDVPNGTCTFSSTIAATNSTAGSGTLSPGSATFEVDLQVDGAVVTQQSIPVMLQSGATITGLSVSPAMSGAVPLEGASVPYVATLQNVDASLSGVSIQGFIRQGGARRFAGGTSVSCGSGSAVLPKGTCTVSSQFTATNNSSGKGTLVSGDATLELQLMDANGAALNTLTLPLTIVEGPLQSPPPGADPSANRLVGARVRLTTKP